MNQAEYLKARLEATLSPMDYLTAAKAAPEDFLLVDVRNAPANLKKIKIAGALEIPEKELTERLPELPKNKTIVVYCWDTWCNLAAKASVILLENGYRVKELTGGIHAWQVMNLPVEVLA